MRRSLVLALAVLLSGAAVVAQGARVDPERLLADRFQFTAKELAQVRQRQPAVKVKVDGTEMGIVGAVRLPGRKERLADWVKNIEHFRRSAELGAARPVALPISAAAFAGVPEGAPGMRQTLLDRARAYATKGNPDEVRALLGRAATLTQIAPALTSFLERFPTPRPEGVDELFYWSVTPVGSNSIVSFHHLVFCTVNPGELWIADKNVYASRYFDAGVMVIGLYDAADGDGFYAIAGSRVKSAQLGGAAGAVLRRQIQRSAADSVKTYLEWIRDSLSVAS